MSTDSGMYLSAVNTNVIIMMNWNIACPIMCLNIVFEMMYSSLECGGLVKSSSDGGSVAKAKDPKVSMIKFSHNI